MSKQIKADLDEIVEAVVSILGDASEGNGYRLTTHKKRWWIEHRHVGSGEPFDQFLRTALEKFVVEEEKCTGERDQNGSCKDCGKKSYHMIPTERKEESVEIHHHSTASVISIDMYQHKGGSEIFKSEMWMDYSVFEKLKEAIDAKANGELSFLFLTTPKKGGEDEA